MSTLYRIDSSIQGDQSVTREILDAFERAFSAADPSATITRRDLLETALSPGAWAHAITAMNTDADRHTPEQASAWRLAVELADEMVAADVIVLAAPLYNWGPSPHVLCWVNLLWTDPRFAPRTYPLSETPMIIATSRGGSGALGGTRGAGWDNSLPYLRHTFGPSVFGAEVTLIEGELALAHKSPAMADLCEQADALRESNLVRAREIGTAVARRRG